MVTKQLQERFGWSVTDVDQSDAAVALTGADGRIEIGSALWDQLVAFGEAHSPEECCGVGIGPAGRVCEFLPVINVHEAPVTRYEISAADQLHIFQRADDRDWDVTLVFHTHPATEPYPSVTDISLAGWPDAVYAILGLGGETPLLRAYEIRDGNVTELAVQAGPR